MKRILAGVVAAGMVFTSCAAVPSGLVGTGIIPQTLARTNEYDYSRLNEFQTKLWQNMASDKSSALSPLSAYIALAMCASGAEGETLDEFNAVGIGGDEQGLALAALISELTAQPAESESESATARIEIADSVWVDDSFEVKSEYLQTLTDYFAAEAFNVDLPSSTERINSWIETKTNSHIKDMLSEIPADTLMMLVSTLYLDAEWETKFDSLSTHPGEFYSNSSTRTEDFMHSSGSVRVVDNDDCVGVVLPYAGGRIEFCALMPSDANLTTSQLIARLDGDDSIPKLAAEAESERVVLALPRFEVETSTSLYDALSSLGLESMFGTSADFSGMTDGNISVSEVLQNVYVRVDEEGTEAAAATAVIMCGGLAETEKPREISFDRPFVWAIYDKISGAILFCGEYN